MTDRQPPEHSSQSDERPEYRTPSRATRSIATVVRADEKPPTPRGRHADPAVDNPPLVPGPVDALKRKPYLILGGLIAVATLALLIVLVLIFPQPGPETDDPPRIAGLPAYITNDMVETALRCQEQYGHPAGATIAQIIQESGQGDVLSELAAQDNNLYGMKWDDYYASAPEVTGASQWSTQEFDQATGTWFTIDDTFIAFTSKRASTEFRSRVFLQGSVYTGNPLIQEAVASRSSDRMAEGLAVDWATDPAYADELKAILSQYDLYRLDNLTLDGYHAL